MVVQSRARTVIGRPVWGGRRACGVVLEGGTLTSSAAGCRRLLVRPPFAGAGNGVVGEVGVVGTLLGPEGTGDRCFCSGVLLFLVPPCSPWGARVRRGRLGGDRLDVENCTVDASIF